jgi:hypothetical protein
LRRDRRREDKQAKNGQCNGSNAPHDRLLPV